MSRVLISTIRTQGGVSRMQDFVCTCLREAGHEPVLAWYEPYSQSPGLSVPLWKTPFRRPRAVDTRSWNGCEGHAVGAWLPELEFTHYQPTRLWRELMETCDLYLGVSGNCLAAAPFALTGKPFLAWIASPWAGDRADRVAAFPPARRAFDRVVVQNAVPRLERRILRSGTIVALSRSTRERLRELGARCDTVLPVPVEVDVFTPRPEAVVPGRIGFSGRLGDPRKNLPLLLEACAILHRSGTKVELMLMGWGGDTAAIDGRIRSLALDGVVRVVPAVPSHDDLCGLLQTVDVFVVPSHQEGLCISALEAMACGCPVVSTRCGGPEEYVVPEETGLLADFSAADVAAKTGRILGDRALRRRLSAGARDRVVERYAPAAARRVFFQALADHRGAHP